MNAEAKAFDKRVDQVEDDGNLDQQIIDELISLGEVALGTKAGGGRSMGHVKGDGRVRRPSGDVETLAPSAQPEGAEWPPDGQPEGGEPLADVDDGKIVPMGTVKPSLSRNPNRKARRAAARARK